MADFKSKLLTLASVATVFAGLAQAQLVCNTATANAVFLRAEGNNEQVADVTLGCAVPLANTAVTAGQTISLTVFMSPSVNITSVAIGSSSTPVNETVAGYNASATTFGGTPKNGVVSGSTVTFSNIALPAIAPGVSQNITITNIKIAASTISSGSGVPAAVTEQIFVQGTGVTPTVLGSSAVGYVTSGLTGVKSSGATANAICNAITSGSTNFSLAFGEGFPNSFKIQGSNTTNTTLGSEFTNHTETGYGQSATSTNTATSGTRVKVVFANVPSGVTVYVPLTSTNSGATVTLTASETGALSAVAASTASGAPASSAAVTLTSGSGTAVYEVTAVSTSPATFAIPVYLVASAGAVPAPASAITATISFAPIGASSNVPNFVSGASTATVNGSTFSACSTTLLFPFVTNQLGFDTGIAISNTSSDLLATKNGAPISLAAQQSGTCSLTFFGSSAPTAAVITPTVATGTAYTAAASTLAPGFQGYAIASCNFLYAHGFAYVVYNLTQNNGAAMGYLADVLPAGRTSPVVITTVSSAGGTIVGGAGTVAATTSTSAPAAVSSAFPESWGH